MFTPHSLEIALLMMITSAVCWGSWANTYKGVKNYRFELFLSLIHISEPTRPY